MKWLTDLLRSIFGGGSGASRSAEIKRFHDKVGKIGRRVKLKRTLTIRGGTLNGRNKDGTITEYVAPKGGTEEEGQPGIVLMNGADVKNIVLKNGDGIRKGENRGVSVIEDVLIHGTYEGAIKANRNSGKMEVQGVVCAGENTVHDVLSLGGNDIHIGTDEPCVFVSDSDANLTTQRTTHSRDSSTKNVKTVKREPTIFVIGKGNKFGKRRDKLQQEGDKVVQR